VNSYWASEQVQLEGEAKRFTRGSDAGCRLDIYFCPECGSSIYWTNDAFPDAIGVAVGAFGDPSFPTPMRAVWTQHKHHWVVLPEGMPEYPVQPQVPQSVR
jgi:hypothetical protein